jgi:hypothetical protein
MIHSKMVVSSNNTGPTNMNMPLSILVSLVPQAELLDNSRQCLGTVSTSPAHQHHREGHGRDHEAIVVRSALSTVTPTAVPDEAQGRRICEAPDIVSDARSLWGEVKLCRVSTEVVQIAEHKNLLEHLRGDCELRHGAAELMLGVRMTDRVVGYRMVTHIAVSRRHVGRRLRIQNLKVK